MVFIMDIIIMDVIIMDIIIMDIIILDITTVFCPPSTAWFSPMNSTSQL